MSDRRPTQADRVLEHITIFGSITRLEAAQAIGCFELSARIIELEARGERFARQRETSRNRYGDKVSFVRYRLAADEGSE